MTTINAPLLDLETEARAAMLRSAKELAVVAGSTGNSEAAREFAQAAATLVQGGLHRPF